MLIVKDLITNRFKKFLLIFFMISVNLIVTGQAEHEEEVVTRDNEELKNALPDERVLVRTDRQIYLCGEKIVYYASTYEGSLLIPLSISSVLYLELYSQENRVISRSKLFLRNGIGTGSIDIPRNVNTGVYFFRAYTNYMKNFGVDHFYLAKIRIVNPFLSSGLTWNVSSDFKRKDQATSSSESVPNLSDDSADYILRNHFTLELKPDRQNYNNREKVIVTVKASDNTGLPVKTKLLILARLIENDTCNIRNSIPEWRFLPVESQNMLPADLKYLPETSGDIISGKLIYTDNTPSAGIEVQQSFTGPAGCIESTKTDSNGNYYFLTNNEMNRGDLIMKIKDPGNKMILIPDNEFFELFPPAGKEIFSLNRSETDLIAKQFVNIQVADAFLDAIKIKTDNYASEMIAFYGNDYTEYIFSDYAKLPNMKEFIFEVIVGVVVLKENKKDIIAILDENSEIRLGPRPLMMIDGIPVTESSAVLSLNPEKVKSVRVIRSKYYYKKQVFDGILDILTNSGSALSLILPDNTYRYGFIHADEINSVIEPVFKNDEGNIPVYRNLLYWNSCISTDEDGLAEATFYTPDNDGEFIIECFGQTSDCSAAEVNTVITVGKNPAE